MSAEDRKAENAQAVEVLSHEVQNLDENTFPTLKAIGENELFRLRGGITDTLDVVDNKRVKIRAKVNIPVDQYPTINFVGKLLGPGGQTLRSIQEETRTKMAILGHGSLRDEAKEKELLSGGDPKYQHLKQPLHLQVDCLAPPAEAYYNISHALAQVKRVMMPENAVVPNAPWSANQPSAPTRGTGPMRGRGRGRGAFNNHGPYGSAMGFSSPPGQAMRVGRGGGRGRGSWGMNGAAAPPNQAAPAQSDVYNNGMEQYAYADPMSYDQAAQYVAAPTGYEEYTAAAAYGQTDAWGKMPTTATDNRGRARTHPYSRPGGKEETA